MKVSPNYDRKTRQDTRNSQVKHCPTSMSSSNPTYNARSKSSTNKPIPTIRARTSIVKDKIKPNQSNADSVVENPIHYDNDPLDEDDDGKNVPAQETFSLLVDSSNNDASLLENTKPPSIIDNQSLMSRSCESTNSDISEIVYDRIPIRKSSIQSQSKIENDSIIAMTASNYAKEIKTMVESCQNEVKNSDSRTQTIIDDQRCTEKTKQIGAKNQSQSSSSSISNDLNLMKINHSIDDLYLRSKATCDDDDVDDQYEKSVDDDNRNNSFNDRTFNITSYKKRFNFDLDQSQTLPNLGKQKANQNRTETKEFCLDTRTYNKVDDKFRKPQQYRYYESDQSDTDISETLPLDDVDPTTDHFDSVAKQIENKSKTNIDQNQKIQTSTSVLYDRPDINLNTSCNLSYSFRMEEQTNCNDSKIDAIKNKIDQWNDDSMPNIYGHHLEKLELIENETRYRLPNNEDVRFRYNSSQQLFCPFTTPTVEPINYASGCRSLSRGLDRLNHKIDFEDKDLMLSSKLRDKVAADHLHYFQKKSNQNSASKYFDRSLSKMDENGSMKVKEKSLLSNVKSKLTASLSSYSNSTSNTSNSNTNTNNNLNQTIETSASKFGKKKESKSKISSFWKRSKSTNDKLNHQTDPIKMDQKRNLSNENESIESFSFDRSNSTRRF